MIDDLFASSVTSVEAMASGLVIGKGEALMTDPVILDGVNIIH